MTDERELHGLDPCDALDTEAARLDAFFSRLVAAAGANADDAVGAGAAEVGEWDRPSRCAGWTTRDMLGHLLAGEDYHRACLEGRASEHIASFGARGASDLDAFNALGVADYSVLPAAEVLERWRAASADNRRGFRERGDGTVDTSVGEYPNRWQAFHVASELATHADDIGVPVTDDERAGRVAWRAKFSRFALEEAKPDIDITVQADRTVVTDGKVTADVDDTELVDGVMGRLDDSSRVGAAQRTLLSTWTES